MIRSWLLLSTLAITGQLSLAWVLILPQTTTLVASTPAPRLASSRSFHTTCLQRKRITRHHGSRVVKVSTSSSSFLETDEGQLDDLENYDNDVYGSTDPTFLANLEIGKLANLSQRNATAVNVAYYILRQIEYPDTISYNGVLKALAKASFFVPRAANMCSDLLQEMEDLFQQQLAANQDWYARNEQGRLSPEELGEGPPRIRVKPNIRSYSTVMDAWSRKSDGRQSAQKAQDLLDKLERLYHEQKESHPQSQHGTLFLQPNVISYNTAIAAWAKSGVPGAPDKCLQLLQNMVQRGVWPDVISYNALLHAYARSALPNAGELAEAILRNNMTKFYDPSTTTRKTQAQPSKQQSQQQPLVQPNARTYTTVMDAWSRSKISGDRNKSSAQRAHALLREMEDLYQQTQDDSIRPNCVSYSTVIHGYALASQREEPYKAYKAWQLLQEMIAMSSSPSSSETLTPHASFNPSAQPSLVTYNNVLNACASSTPPQIIPLTTVTSKVPLHGHSAFSASRNDVKAHSSFDVGRLERLASELSLPKMIQTIYRQLLQDPNLQPDHFTYGTLLKAISNLRSFFNPEDGDPADFIRQVFHDCCQRGRVSSGVLFQLRQSAPLDLYRELVLDVVLPSPTTLPFKSTSPNKKLQSHADHFAQAKSVSIDQVPIAWTRNVRERRRWPAKSSRGGRGNGTD